jgi:hypothetical protein
MTKEIESKNITEHFKEKYKDETLEDRTSRWVLGTIKFQYDVAYIIASGALNEENSSKKNFNKLPKKKQDHLLNICTNAYKPFKKYLLIYTCYLFGAYYENCKRNNVEFLFTAPFLTKQLKNFFGMVNKFYKNPDKDSNLWMPAWDNLFGKEDLDLNKKFFLSHLPPLEKKHFDSIVNWFLDNRKTNQAIQVVFDTARNYFHLEDDENSPFKKITSANDMAGTIEFASDGDKKRYKNSTLSKDHILRSTYYKLAVNNLTEVNDCYLNTKPGARVWIVQDLISKIIRNGPDLKYSEQEYENII